MDYSQLPWKSCAIVVWMPEGEKPDGAEHFSVGANLSPPKPNPEAWWELGQALLSVRAVENDYMKRPWIKVGEVVLEPDQILQAYEYFKNHGYGNA